MDLVVEINPSGLEEAYISGLNESFGHWGDRATYDWAFQREVGARPADLMVLRDDDEILAGSAVSYRTVRLERSEFLVGVMTGSWTLPAARGRGAFSQVIDESRRLVDARGGSVLIAFVTHDNASRRRLVAAGCVEVPTWYVASGDETSAPADTPPVQQSAATAEELFDAYRRWQDAGTGATVVYPSVDVWARQYLERSLPVERLMAAGCLCLVERAPLSDRVLWADGPDPRAAMASLLGRAVATGRQLFVFTVDAGMTRAMVDLGMVAKPGSITVLGGFDVPKRGPGRTVPTEWRLQGGDRA